jgi:hypothetical protein
LYFSLTAPCVAVIQSSDYKFISIEIYSFVSLIYAYSRKVCLEKRNKIKVKRRKGIEFLLGAGLSLCPSKQPVLGTGAAKL